MPLALRFDGASKGNPGPAGAAWVLVDLPTGKTVAWERVYMGPRKTNNEAEYAGLLAGLRYLESRPGGARDVRVQGDSKLVVMQARGRWKCKAAHLQAAAKECRERLRALGGPEIEWIPRERNAAADRQANAAVESRESANFFGS